MTTPVLDLSQYYQPHAGQQEYHDSPAKKKYKEEGRRYGKSRGAFWDMTKDYTDSWDVQAPPSLVPPWNAWIVVPAYPQSHQVWNEILAFLPKELVWPGGIHQDDHMVYLRGPETRPWGQISVKSAHNPDALQTEGLDYLWVTEAQDVSDQAWEKLLPMLTSPDRRGRMTAEGIPALHSGHWFRRGCIAAKEGLISDAAYFHHTAFDNPFLTAEQLAEIEEHRELLPDRAWRRMYLAEFNEDAGYFSNVNACIAGSLLFEPNPGTSYVAGLDLGRKMDATVLFIGDAAERKVVYHDAWDSSSEWVTIMENIVKTCRFWNVQRLVIDAIGMGGDMFVSEMQEAGLPVEGFTIGDNRTLTGTRTALLQELAVSLERQTVHFPSIPPLLRQLRAFQYRRLPSGTFRAEAAPGEHDDEVFALALMLTACNEAAPVTPVTRSYRRSRYVPTQEEANNGTFNRSPAAMKARGRMVERIRERQEMAGVKE